MAKGVRGFKKAGCTKMQIQLIIITKDTPQIKPTITAHKQDK